MRRSSSRNSRINLVNEIAEITGLYKYQVRLVIKTFIQYIVAELCVGKEVHIFSLGKFYIKKVKGRMSVNPYNKKRIKLKDAYLPKFIYGGRAFVFIKQEARRFFERGTG